MSSKILGQADAEAALPLSWRQLRRPEGEQAPPGPGVEPFVARRNNQQDDTSSIASAAPPPAAPPPGVPLELYQALEQRCREAEARLPAVEKQARQAGFKEGEQAAQARWEKALEQATRAAAEIAALRPILRRRAEEDVVRLAMAIARRILRREATIDTDAVLGLLKAGLERIEQREVSQVRVRPDDVPTVSRYLERIGSPYRIEVIPDSTLERGGMILETNKGSLDASLETQLEEIERGFTDLLKPR